MLTGAAWSVQQSLDGLGLTSSYFPSMDGGGALAGGYWSPGEAVLPIVGALILLWMLLSSALVVSGYVLGRWKGAFIVVVLLALPGVLSMSSLWPDIPFLPDEYAIGGAGILGSPWGALFLLLMAVAVGWTLGVMLMDALYIGERFWSGFDHLWYAVGLVAVVFFVADAQSGVHVRNLGEVSRDAQRASAYLQRQAGEYDKHCRQNGGAPRLSCEWASDIQQRLLDYQTEDAILFAEFGPKNSADLYRRFTGPSSISEIETIRSEIAAYNAALCPVRQLNDQVKQLARPSAVCQSTPAAFCRSFPEPFKGMVDKESGSATTALASECIIPSLVYFKKLHVQYVEQVLRDKRNKHHRWFYYLIFSVFAGLKVSNGTMKLAGLHLRKGPDKRRSLHLLFRVWKLVRATAAGVLSCRARLVRVIVRACWNPAMRIMRRAKIRGRRN